MGRNTRTVIQGCVTRMNKKERLSFVEYHLKELLVPECRVLDLGCGTAQYRDSFKWIYVGLDITSLPYSDGFPRDVNVVASGSKLPFAEGSFNLIFSVAAFYQMPDSEMVLKECHRILKPGGQLLLFDYNRRTQRLLEKKEGHRLPCWNYWQLKRLFQKAYFKNIQWRSAVAASRTLFQQAISYWMSEWRGQWLIIKGNK